MKVLETGLNFIIGIKPSANKSARWVLCFMQETLSDENLTLASIPTSPLTQLSPFLVNITFVAKSTGCSSILIWLALPEVLDTACHIPGLKLFSLAFYGTTFSQVSMALWLLPLSSSAAGPHLPYGWSVILSPPTPPSPVSKTSSWHLVHFRGFKNIPCMPITDVILYINHTSIKN